MEADLFRRSVAAVANAKSATTWLDIAQQELQDTMDFSQSLREPLQFVEPYRAPWIRFVLWEQRNPASRWERVARCVTRDQLRADFKRQLDDFRLVSYVLPGVATTEKLEQMYLRCSGARTAYLKHMLDHGCSKARENPDTALGAYPSGIESV